MLQGIRPQNCKSPSSTSYPTALALAWVVYFIDGSIFTDSTSNIFYVRLVRSGQSLAAFDLLLDAPANVVPTATALAISGTAQFGQVLTGAYVYADADSDAQDVSGTGSSYRFVRSTDASVATTGDTADAASGVTGGVDKTYTMQAADVGKYLFYCVTPKALTGLSPGLEACSSASSAVGTASQAALTLTSTSGSFGTPLTLTASGGTGTGTLGNSNGQTPGFAGETGEV